MKKINKAQETLASPEFKKLVSQRWTISLILTFLMLAVYLGFIFAVAFAKDLLAVKLGAHLNWGLLLGLGIIIFTWIITGVYVYWANSKYDKMVNEIKQKYM
jgi:uncharacterized membrane protein (DUF485 family)